MAKSKQAVHEPESEYTAAELAQAAHIFGTRPEVVTAALASKNITKTTEKNAAAIVSAFLNREVK